MTDAALRSFQRSSSKGPTRAPSFIWATATSLPQCALRSPARYIITKPADADNVVSALLAPKGRKAEPPKHPLSAPRALGAHSDINEQRDHNVSEAARWLDMHRRTLQRVLARQAPR